VDMPYFEMIEPPLAMQSNHITENFEKGPSMFTCSGLLQFWESFHIRWSLKWRVIYRPTYIKYF